MLTNEEYSKTFIRMMDSLRDKCYKGRPTCDGVFCSDCPLSEEVCCHNSGANINRLINAVKAIEIVEEWGEKNPKGLPELPDYHFDRNEFVNTFKEIFTEDEFVDLEVKCQGSTNAYDFLLYWQEDTFYIMHLASGTIISWYKHLGRANTCNKEDFDIPDLKEFLLLLKKDLDLLPARGGAK